MNSKSPPGLLLALAAPDLDFPQLAADRRVQSLDLHVPSAFLAQRTVEFSRLVGPQSERSALCGILEVQLGRERDFPELHRASNLQHRNPQVERCRARRDLDPLAQPGPAVVAFDLDPVVPRRQFLLAQPPLGRGDGYRRRLFHPDRFPQDLGEFNPPIVAGGIQSGLQKDLESGRAFQDQRAIQSDLGPLGDPDRRELGGSEAFLPRDQLVAAGGHFGNLKESAFVDRSGEAQPLPTGSFLAQDRTAPDFRDQLDLAGGVDSRPFAGLHPARDRRTGPHGEISQLNCFPPGESLPPPVVGDHPRSADAEVPCACGNRAFPGTAFPDGAGNGPRRAVP